MKIRKILKKFKEFLVNNKVVFILAIPFVLMYLFVTILCLKVPYNFKNYLSPILFTTTWLILFIGTSINLKKPLGKLLYILIYSIFLVIFLVNGVYFSIMNKVIDFSLTESVSEGMPYVLDSIKNTPVYIYIEFIVLLISFLIAIKKFPSRRDNNYKNILTCALVFLVMHMLTPLTLGKEHTELTWSSWRNARNIYIAYNDANKSLKVSGFFEYIIKNYYITFLKTSEQENEEDNEFLVTSHEEVEKNENRFTGLLEGKNLIIVQLEGMDNWIVNEEDTPTIYKMMKEGINFTNHYSFYNGGGSTFNSEFAINTGYVTPFSFTKNAYSFNKNSFPYSLANLFKKEGYRVNAFHMNSGEYYSRTINYINWGYDNYYGLKDQGTYTDSSYELDRELILNEKFNELMFSNDKKFVDYIITYSGHLPFTNTKGVCKMLYDMDNTKEITEEEDTNEEVEFTLMSEEECIRRQNRETDYMVKLLLEKLEEKELLDNTAIVLVTDHYLYTVEDTSILDRYKETSNNLINKTPFIIWSNDINRYEVKEVTSQLNILPTILNLYGIKYNPNNYIMEDALSSNYKGMVFFNDYSWYDGKAYVDGENVISSSSISEEEIENKNYRVSYLTKKNDLTLRFNFFNR